MCAVCSAKTTHETTAARAAELERQLALRPSAAGTVLQAPEGTATSTDGSRTNPFVVPSPVKRPGAPSTPRPASESAPNKRAKADVQGPDAGGSDAEAATSDAGAFDARTPDAGASDARTPDAPTSDARASLVAQEKTLERLAEMAILSDSSDGEGGLAGELDFGELGGGEVHCEEESGSSWSKLRAGRRHVYGDFRLYGKCCQRKVNRNDVYYFVWYLPHPANVQVGATGIAYDGSTGNGVGRGNEFGPRQMRCPDRPRPADLHADIAASVAYFANKAKDLQADEVHTQVGRAPVHVRARFC